MNKTPLKIMPTANQQDKSSTMKLSATTDSAMFNPIDLEASLGRIEDVDSNDRENYVFHESTSSCSSSQEQHRIEQLSSPKSSRIGVTRTSSRTPFLNDVEDGTRKNSSSSSSLLKPYPISETDDEIKERKRLTETMDWSNGLVVNSPPNTSINAAESGDQQSMMEVTVDDFVLSAEEAGSLNDLDARTIQDDPVGFWETPAQVTKSLSIESADVDMSAVPFSVTFSSQDPCIDDIDNEEGLTDALPIRSVDMEW